MLSLSFYAHSILGQQCLGDVEFSLARVVALCGARFSRLGVVALRRSVDAPSGAVGVRSPSRDDSSQRYESAG